MTGATFVANEVVAALERMPLEDGVPVIESAISSISYRCQADKEVGFRDAIAFNSDLDVTNFTFETGQISIMEDLLEIGGQHVEMLYCFRSCARGIPQVKVGDTGSFELYQRTFDVLNPEMEKLMQMREFVERCKETFSSLISEMCKPERKKKLVPDELYIVMTKVIDLLLKLDSLKDIKASVQNDLAQYKRAILKVEKQLANANVVKESIHKLQMFLASPQHPQSHIFHDLKDSLQRIEGHDEVFANLLQFCLESLQQGRYHTPNEKYRLIRSLPHLMLLIDGDGDDKGSTNVFKHPKVSPKMLKSIREMFKAHPVVPIYGDMALTLIQIIRRATHFDYEDMAGDWGHQPEEKVRQSYDILTHWPKIRAESSIFNTKFQNMVNEVREKGGSLDNASQTEVANTVKTGLRLLRDWVTAILDMATWKYTNPATADRLQNVGAKTDKFGQHHQYETVIRYNFTKEELGVLVDCISMIKSLGSMMKRAESVLAPVLRNHVHHELQKYVQIDLLPMLHHLDQKAKKKEKGISFKALTVMRSIAADWKDGIPPDDSSYSSKDLKNRAALDKKMAELPKRTVPHSKTQMLLVRSISQALVDERYEGQKSSMFGSKDFEKASEDTIRKFCVDSTFFDRLLDFSSTVNELTDLSDLWYREFYLEMTKEVQFPIGMSLPWILTEHVIQNAAHSYSSSTSHMIESLLYTMDVYNDAAQRAFSRLRKQFVYDEIEGEVNLCFTQMIVLISDHLYTYYKNVASSNLLDKAYREKIMTMQSMSKLKTTKRRYEIPMGQRHIQLLGRSVNLNLLIANKIRQTLHKDLSLTFSNFESNDLTHIIEFESTISVIKLTHQLLGDCIDALDPWDTIYNECNETVSATEIRGTVIDAVYEKMASEFLGTYAYNMHTQRFVKPLGTEKEKSTKGAVSNLGYGSTCARAWEIANKLTFGFFGIPHIQSLIRVIGESSLPQLLNPLLENVQDIVAGHFVPWIETLREAIPPCKPPKIQIERGHLAYGFFEAKLKPLLGFDNMKTEIFQSFRIVGNFLALCFLIDTVLVQHDTSSFVMHAPFVGVTPDNVHGTVADFKKKSAILNIFNSFVVDPNNGYATAEVLASLPMLAQRNHDMYTPKKANLVANVVQKIDAILDRTGAKSKWMGSTPDNRVMDVEQNEEFYKVWSVMQFLFCFPESSGTLADEDTFGHGFAWAGCAIIHMLQQRHRFEMFDFSYYTVNAIELDASVIKTEEEIEAAKPKLKKGQQPQMNLDDTLKAEAKRFSYYVANIKTVNNIIFATLNAVLPKQEKMVVQFKGPEDDEDLARASQH